MWKIMRIWDLIVLNMMHNTKLLMGLKIAFGFLWNTIFKKRYFFICCLSSVYACTISDVWVFRSDIIIRGSCHDEVVTSDLLSVFLHIVSRWNELLVRVSYRHSNCSSLLHLHHVQAYWQNMILPLSLCIYLCMF